MSVTEQVCQFGPDEHLVGVLTAPAARTQPHAVVLVNAGLVPKAGPFRLYAQLARQLAAAGFAVLRFDLGGLGDSTAAHPGEPLRARTALDIAAAVDELVARTGCAGVIVGGLCSGAEDAFRYAEHDPRVRGLVMIDPAAYRTRGWQRHHLAYRAARRALRAVGVYKPMVTGAPSGDAAGGKVVHYAYMEQPEAARILGALIARRAHVHFVYTGGARDTFNHRGQLAAMFPALALAPFVTLDHLPQLDHTQLLDEDRRVVIDAITKALTSRAWVAARG